MFVELFGPPGVGKTTVARALAVRLRERGQRVKLVLSFRSPKERVPRHDDRAPPPHLPALLHRLGRPMVETVAAFAGPADPCGASMITELMRLLPPEGVVRSLRLRQYLVRLIRNRGRAAAVAGDVVLFDQGFVQAVYSLATLGKTADRESIGRALDAVPRVELVVRLDAPAECLRARLAERRLRQGKIERLLDSWSAFGSSGTFNQLDELLQIRGQTIARVDTGDRRSLNAGLDKVEAIIREIQGATAIVSATHRLGLE
ncbi:MAG: AAA family ATPase [Stellaceae bacterium]